MMTNKDIADAIRVALKIWNAIYTIELSSTGSAKRAEQLTRGHMNEWLHSNKRYINISRLREIEQKGVI